MNRKRWWMIIGTGIGVMLVVGVLVARVTLNCCALPPRPFELTETAIVSQNQAISDQFTATHTPIFRPTRTPLPYDATLYAQRRQQEMMLQTAAGPTQWAIFFATETALVATYQGTVLPTFTPISYDASMSPTALPQFSRTPTPTPTLCPYSDVVCPSGNETLSPADKVMVLMASANAPEFGQLAQTATAYAVTHTPTPASKASSTACAFTWAHQDLPEIAETAQEAFTEANSGTLTVIRADAYGESCGSGFAAMTTDFYLSASVSDLNDSEAVGQIVSEAYGVLINLDAKLPAKHGYLDIMFMADGAEKQFRTMFSQLRSTIEAGASGVDVLEAGGGLQ